MVLSTVLVTGSSRGLGLELVRQLAQKSNVVVASCRNPDGAQNLQRVAEQYPDNVFIRKLDVDHHESFPTFVSKMNTILKKDGLTCVINNAGIAPKATRYSTVTAGQMEATMRTNALASLFLSRALLPLLKTGATKSPKGSLILNMSSILGSVGCNQKVMEYGGTGGGQYAYRTSKAALNMITRSLSLDLATININAMAVHPGWVLTDLGGPKAPLSSEKSVSGIIALVEQFDKEKHNGNFFDYQGRQMQW